MHWRTALIVILAVMAMLPAVAGAQEVLLPRDKHPWGRLPLGSWKRMRQTAEAFDDRGVATTTTHHLKTTLKSADVTTCTLVSEQMLEVGGRGFAPTVKEVVLNYSGENSPQKLDNIKVLGEREVVVSGRRVPCEVRQATFLGMGEAQTTLTLLYSPEVSPYALRREWSTVAAAGGEPTSIVEEVVATGMPYEVLGQRLTVAFVQTKHTLPRLTRETIEVRSEEVPGGVVGRWSKELGADGKLASRVTLELLEYHVPRPPPAASRPRLFDRKRSRRGDEK